MTAFTVHYYFYTTRFQAIHLSDDWLPFTTTIDWQN